jgi:NAD(P)-dependent dehydrogenase (short-subunit alcohol dehydrogenase family)
MSDDRIRTHLTTQLEDFMTEKVWFITGCSRGFGRVWAEAALERGDKVVATARDVGSLGGLAAAHPDTCLAVPVDVTDRASIAAAVESAVTRFGRIDVVVNNAGFAVLGAVEEVDENDVRDLFDTNVFGALWVLQATLPVLRAQGGGHVVNVTSLAGLIGEPVLGLYNASKWALEGLSEALALEVEHLGIKVTAVEPGPYATEFGSTSSLRRAAENPAYDQARSRLYSSFDPTTDIGDPTATAAAVFRAVDADDPPRRLTLGNTVFPRARDRYAERLATWDAWAAVSAAAHASPD